MLIIRKFKNMTTYRVRAGQEKDNTNYVILISQFIYLTDYHSNIIINSNIPRSDSTTPVPTIQLLFPYELNALCKSVTDNNNIYSNK